jgi:hypothetical protein
VVRSSAASDVYKRQMMKPATTLHRLAASVGFRVQIG